MAAGGLAVGCGRPGACAVKPWLSVGIELNETYAQLAARRLQQLSLLAEGGYA